MFTSLGLRNAEDSSVPHFAFIGRDQAVSRGARPTPGNPLLRHVGVSRPIVRSDFRPDGGLPRISSITPLEAPTSSPTVRLSLQQKECPRMGALTCIND